MRASRQERRRGLLKGALAARRGRGGWSRSRSAARVLGARPPDGERASRWGDVAALLGGAGTTKHLKKSLSAPNK